MNSWLGLWCVCSYVHKARMRACAYVSVWGLTGVRCAAMCTPEVAGIDPGPASRYSDADHPRCATRGPIACSLLQHLISACFHIIYERMISVLEYSDMNALFYNTNILQHAVFSNLLFSYSIRLKISNLLIYKLHLSTSH